MTPSVLALVGPTAAGKSSVAMAAAESIGGVELVSVDSMQVYREMDIGTAKPTTDEQRRVPHHLIDLVEPAEEFGVAEFQRAHRTVMDDLAARRRRAILVGGTGLYHRAVIDDLDLPGEWPDVRARLVTECDAVGPAELHRRLAAVDPDAAAKMEPTNERRIVRALEVFEGSGRRFSSYGPGLDAYPRTGVVQVGLRWERARLAERIEQRVHRMIAAGLIDEVDQIRAAGGFSRTAGQALGYKEVLGHLDGLRSLAETIDLIVVRTRQFAVRQERWFRRDPRVRWVDIETDPVAEALPIVLAATGSAGSRPLS